MRSEEKRRSEEHTSELQSHLNLVCRLLLEKTVNHQEARGARECAGDVLAQRAALHSRVSTLRVRPPPRVRAEAPLSLVVLFFFFFWRREPPIPPLSPAEPLLVH